MKLSENHHQQKNQILIVPPYYYDETRIWEDDIYPIRFDVEIISILDMDRAVPMKALVNKLELNYPIYFRRPLRQINRHDAEIILEAIGCKKSERPFFRIIVDED